jgi:hypothetical protein
VTRYKIYKIASQTNVSRYIFSSEGGVACQLLGALDVMMPLSGDRRRVQVVARRGFGGIWVFGYLGIWVFGCLGIWVLGC